MSDAPRQPTKVPLQGQEPAVPAFPPSGRKLSMHEDVPVWYDCCSCEAEPYWVEQLGEPPDGKDTPPANG